MKRKNQPGYAPRRGADGRTVWSPIGPKVNTIELNLIENSAGPGLTFEEFENMNHLERGDAFFQGDVTDLNSIRELLYSPDPVVQRGALDHLIDNDWPTLSQKINNSHLRTDKLSLAFLQGVTSNIARVDIRGGETGEIGYIGQEIDGSFTALSAKNYHGSGEPIGKFNNPSDALRAIEVKNMQEGGPARRAAAENDMDIFNYMVTSGQDNTPSKRIPFVTPTADVHIEDDGSAKIYIEQEDGSWEQAASVELDGDKWVIQNADKEIIALGAKRFGQAVIGGYLMTRPYSKGGNIFP